MSDKLAEVIAAHRWQQIQYGNGEDYYTRYELCVCGERIPEDGYPLHVADVIRKAFVLAPIDHDAGAAYIAYSDKPVHRTLNPVDAVNIDLDRDGGVVGVELLALPNLEVAE